LQQDHEKAVEELDAFRTQQTSYVMQHIAPAHWRQVAIIIGSLSNRRRYRLDLLYVKPR
jgi:hypothetical protein